MKSTSNLLLCAICVTALTWSHQARGDDAAPITGVYWFDQSAVRTSFTPGNTEITAAGLSEGLHSLHAYVENAEGVPSSVITQWFIKTMTVTAGGVYKAVVFIDGKPREALDFIGNADGLFRLPLDMNDIELGLHTLQVQIVSPSGIPMGTKEALFMRVPSTAQLATMHGYYLLDGKYAGDIRPALDGSAYHLDIDASSLTSGLHSVAVYMANPIGLTTSMRTAWFIKTPAGGEGVSSYEYWINDDYSTLQAVTLDKVANPLQLISLHEVAEQPFRTSCFTFAVEDGKPAVYPKNNFQIRFSDPDGRITMGSCDYTDTRGRMEVTDVRALAEPLNTFDETIAADVIRWYSIEAEQGDSVAVRLSGAGMIELYGPDGSTVLSRTGVDATTPGSTTIRANGTHYVAVHDVASASRSVKVGIDHIGRHAICSFTPEECARGTEMIMRVEGNGFDHLTAVRLAGNGLRVDATETVADDNYSLAVLFSPDKALDTGEYHLECVFTDPDNGSEETVVSASALTVAEAHPAAPEVEIVDSHIIATPYVATVRVVNPGNVPYMCVPLHVAIPEVREGGDIDFLGFYRPDDETADPEDLNLFAPVDSLFDMNRQGYYGNMLIPYLGPGETLTFDVGFTTGPHELVTWYAWCGKPWNVEADEMESDDYDASQILTPDETATISLRDIANILYRDAAAEDGDDDDEEEEAEAAMARRKVTVKSVVGLTVSKARSTMSLLATGTLASLPCTATPAASLLRNGNGLNPAMGLNAFRNHYMVSTISAIGRTFTPSAYRVGKITFKKKGQASKPEEAKAHTTDCYQSGDPNEMFGYTSPSGDIYIGCGVRTLDYTIEFENDPEIANASATRIKVNNTLDGKSFDLSSFTPTTMRIGDKECDLPTSHHFVRTLDMRPGINSIAELTFDYDADAGEATWSLRTLDPMTLEPTRYMDDGILPVNNDNGQGIGYLSYSIGLRVDLPDGTDVTNSAVIVFDDNAPIATPVYRNITDFTLPTARLVSTNTDDNLTFTFEAEGSDSGSGIWFYDLYMRAADSENWTLVATQIEDNTFSYTADADASGASFTVVATDRAGNRQRTIFLGAMAGDADSNGAVDANDVVLTRNYYTGRTTDINTVCADVTMDGKIDTQDATAIRNIYLKNHKKAIRQRLNKRK